MLLINFMTNRYILRSETGNMLRLNGSIIWVLVVLMQGGLMTAVTFAPSKSANLSCDTEYAYYPDPNDCSAFYQCIGGIKQHMECVFPLLWDNHIQGCEEESDCSQVISTTSGELTSTQVVSTTSLGPTFTQVISTTSGELTSTSICEDGDVTRDIQSCQMFYCCENNQWSGPKKCPSSLYWSENRKGCVKYSESDCILTTTKYKMYY